MPTVKITKSFAAYHVGQVVDVSEKLAARYVESDRGVVVGTAEEEPDDDTLLEDDAAEEPV